MNNGERDSRSHERLASNACTEALIAQQLGLCAVPTWAIPFLADDVFAARKLGVAAAPRAPLELLVHLLDHRLPQPDARVDEPVGDLGNAATYIFIPCFFLC